MVINSISARAVVPDQLLDYVAAVSGLDSEIIGSCVLHHGGGQGVLVAYPVHEPGDEESARQAVEEAARLPYIDHLTVLAAKAPDNITTPCKKDMWWLLDLPWQPANAKLRNMLKRAARDVNISNGAGPGAWTGQHARLMTDFCSRKKDTLDEGTLYIYQRLPEYLGKASKSILFSAYGKNGSLAAFAIGDYSALTTAFYMFACRSASAPPGTADLLLRAIVEEAEKRGYARVNLGLGIDQGIEFFKRKWGAREFLPYVEFDVVKPAKRGFWSRLLRCNR